MSGEPPSDAPYKPVWRSIAPSVLILVGVFFFISSACFRSSGGDDYAEVCPGVGANTPAGASVAILEPREDQTFSGTKSWVDVPIRLMAFGIELAPQHACDAGTAHFSVQIRRSAGGPCLVQTGIAPLVLSDGADAAVTQLPAGSYELTARLVSPNGHLYYPNVEASVRFVVDAPAPLPDAGGCP